MAQKQNVAEDKAMPKRKPKRITIQEFTKRFAAEEACRDYLAEKRWPNVLSVLNAAARGTVFFPTVCTSVQGAIARHTSQQAESGNLQWIHTIICNAKAFIMGTSHGLPKKYLQEYMNEFCYRFSRRWFGSVLFERQALAMVASPSADQK